MGVVGMKINKGMKVYDDAAATIKSAGLIGDKYVKIDPGGAGAVLKPQRRNHADVCARGHRRPYRQVRLRRREERT